MYIHTYVHIHACIYTQVNTVHTYMRTYLNNAIGYRGAQCGWLIVEESNIATGDSTSREALCLCVYLPKRGLLEVQYIQYIHTHMCT